jgi:hypothetical protein
MKHFNGYKSVCHFIAAFELLEADPLSLEDPNQVKAFLKTAQWIREKLLSIRTPNIKDKILFSQESLIPLPSWVNSQDVNIPLEPFQDIIKELEEQLRIAEEKLAT